MRLRLRPPSKAGSQTAFASAPKGDFGRPFSWSARSHDRGLDIALIALDHKKAAMVRVRLSSPPSCRAAIWTRPERTEGACVTRSGLEV